MTNTAQNQHPRRSPANARKESEKGSAAKHPGQRTKPVRPNAKKAPRQAGSLKSAVRFALIGGLGLVAGLSADRYNIIEDARALVLNTAEAVGQEARPGISPAISAVLNALPSVAILGEKDGPGSTTEVFIQVPGVLNMQSVYVLSDNKTVISGIVVEPVERIGFPGRSVEQPTGKASVNPLEPRTDAARMAATIGATQPAPSLSPKASIPTPGDTVKQIPAPNDVAGEVPVPSQEDSVNPAPNSVATSVIPEPPAPEAKRSFSVNGKSGSAGTRTSSPSVAAVPESSAPPEASPRASAQQQSAPSVSSGQPKHVAMSQGTVKNYNGDEPFIIDSIDSMVGSGPFGKAVRHMLKNDTDIDEVRQQSNAKQQQQAYYDLIASLPAITQGSGPREVYVMFDPNCPVCHAYYKDVITDIKNGRLTVHWIPVIVFPDERSSLTTAAAILAAIDRGEGAGNILHNAMTEPGYTAKVDQSDRVKALTPYFESVVKNTSVMAMSKAETPLLVFQNTDGNLVINGGIPQDGYISMIGRDGK